MLEYPETMTPAIRSVLGMMCFQCVSIAEVLRKSGTAIERRAEDEQAAVLHYLLGFALRDGEGWREKAAADLRDRSQSPSSGE